MPFTVTFLSILRLDELQKQLQEDIRQGRGIKSPIRIGDQDSTDDEDGLLEEHRYSTFANFVCVK